MKKSGWLAVLPALAAWVLLGAFAAPGAHAQLSLDSDLTPGFQGGSLSDAEAGGTVTFELIGKGLSMANGYSATLSYDDSKLTFESFKSSELIPNFTGLVIRGSGSIEIGGGSLEGHSATDYGQLGTVTFSVASGFTGTSAVSLGDAKLLISNVANAVSGSSSITVGGEPEDAIVLDAGLSSGYQGGRGVDPVAVGDDVTLELYATELAGAQGYSASLQFNAQHLRLSAFRDGGLIPGLTGLIDREDAGEVQVGGGSVSGTASAADGRLATVTFTVLPGFRGSTTVTLLGGVISKADGAVTVTNSTAVALTGVVLTNPADFDGSGRVDFEDFLEFAGGFGKSLGQAGFDARFDLDGNGSVEFEDFLLFAAEFGK